MNSQASIKMFPKEIQDKILNTFKSNGVQIIESEIDYYAWPQLFGSTAGPNGGWGGSAMTTFTVHAFVYNDEVAVLVCSRQIRFVEKFKFFMKF